MEYIRVPDTYYTDQIFDGQPTVEPTRFSRLLEYFVGEDVLIEGFYIRNGAPVAVDKWDLSLVLNTDPFAQLHSWDGVLNNGIYEGDRVGHYKIIIPSEVTSTLVPGTYWLSLIAKEKIGSDPHAIKDITVILARYPISFNFSGALPQQYSPGERKQLEQTIPLASDPTTHIGTNVV